MIQKITVGADIGCNHAKLYAGNGRKISIRSTVSTKPQVGISLGGATKGPDEIVIQVGSSVYAVGPRVESPLDTRFGSYYSSDMNAALVLAILVQEFGDLSSAEVDAVFGMPLNVFYNSRGEVNSDLIKARVKAWRQPASVLSAGRAGLQLPRGGSVFANLNGTAEGVAVYLDYMMDEEGMFQVEPEGLDVVVDIGGNTTDLALFENGVLVFGGNSDSFEVGALHLYERVANTVKDRMGLMRTPPLYAVEQAIRENGSRLKIGNSEENIRDIVAIETRAIVNEIVPRVEKIVSRRRDELRRVLFAGGTTEMLRDDLKGVEIGRAQSIVVDDPQYANAKGNYKLARHLAATQE